jgi:hypothetical protein
MSERRLETIRDWIQEDVGRRGLRADPAVNLVTACAGDFAAACRSLASTAHPEAAIVTGFFIPHAQPPAAETDGPLGALFLARALAQMGARVVLATDLFCAQALQAGLTACGLEKIVQVVVLPAPNQAGTMAPEEYWQAFAQRAGRLTHLIALERVGPSHTPASLAEQAGETDHVLEQFLNEVPADHHDRCHTMKGRDITASMSPAHLLFEVARRQSPAITTIGIGDGGNEIGMGKIAWNIIRRNIPGGGMVACRVPADHLIVCGVSNWGAYGLAAGTSLLRDALPDDFFNPAREEVLLQVMVDRGPLVDGITGQPGLSVDGLTFEQYTAPLRRLQGLMAGARGQGPGVRD